MELFPICAWSFVSLASVRSSIEVTPAVCSRRLPCWQMASTLEGTCSPAQFGTGSLVEFVTASTRSSLDMYTPVTESDVEYSDEFDSAGVTDEAHSRGECSDDSEYDDDFSCEVEVEVLSPPPGCGGSPLGVAPKPLLPSSAACPLRRTVFRPAAVSSGGGGGGKFALASVPNTSAASCSFFLQARLVSGVRAVRALAMLELMDGPMELEPKPTGITCVPTLGSAPGPRALRGPRTGRSSADANPKAQGPETAQEREVGVARLGRAIVFCGLPVPSPSCS